MSQENVDIVRRAYEEAYPARAVERFIREWSTEDFRWHMRAEWPGKRFYTASEMTEIWADLDETYSDFSMVPKEYVDGGDFVLVTLRMSARLRGSDDRLDSATFHVWEVREGRAIQAWSFSEKDEALAAAGLSEP